MSTEVDEHQKYKILKKQNNETESQLLTQPLKAQYSDIGIEITSFDKHMD